LPLPQTSATLLASLLAPQALHRGSRLL